MKMSKSFQFIKDHIVEILVGGGIVLQGYNIAFVPARDCSSPTSGLAGFPGLNCSDVQSPELLFIAIIMIVIGVAIFFNIKKQK